jgi:hypothetical protein
MSMDTKNLIDVTDWPLIEDRTVDGTRDKYVLTQLALDSQNESLYIVKLPTKHGGDNEVITEWMATTLLGKAWGFDVHDCELCIFNAQLALKMVPLVTKGKTKLVTMKDIMGNPDQGYEEELTRNQHAELHTQIQVSSAAGG